MADDTFNASALRQRNLKGGSLKDDELSASQLRARQGIAGNKWAAEKDEGGLSPIVVVIIGLLIAAVIAWLALRGSK